MDGLNSSENSDFNKIKHFDNLLDSLVNDKLSRFKSLYINNRTNEMSVGFIRFSGQEKLNFEKIVEKAGEILGQAELENERQLKDFLPLLHRISSNLSKLAGIKEIDQIVAENLLSAAVNEKQVISNMGRLHVSPSNAFNEKGQLISENQTNDTSISRALSMKEAIKQILGRNVLVPYWQKVSKEKNEIMIHENHSLFGRSIQVDPKGLVLQLDVKDLGQGTFKTVKVAEDLFGKGVFASAILAEGIAGQDELNERVSKEIKALELVSGIPGCVRLYSAVSYKDQEGILKYRLTFEFASGGNLEKAIKNNELNDNNRFDIALRITTTLNEIHKKGLVFRDLKAENILLPKNKEEDYPINISDFGTLCKKGAGECSEVAGTYEYHSPEYARALINHPEPDPRKIKESLKKINLDATPDELDILTGIHIANMTKEREQALKKATTEEHDVWALGCLIYELYHHPQTLPWITEDGKKQAKAIANYQSSEYSLFHKDQEKTAMDELIEKMLQSDPKKRISLSAALSELRLINPDHPAFSTRSRR